MILDLPVTAAILAATLVLLVVIRLIERKPLPLGEVRLLPLNFLTLVLGLVAILMLAHLISLLTGQPLLGRGGYLRY